MNKQLQKVQTLPSLLCDDDGHYELACTKLEDRREYTANRLWKKDPAKYRLAVRLISEMLSTRMIAAACEVSPTTVEAIRVRERFSIEKEREQLLATVRAGTRICAERVVELATTMNAKEAAITFGILAEKQQLLAGEPTVIIGKEDQMKHASFNEMLAGLSQANAHEVSDSASVKEDKPGAEA